MPRLHHALQPLLCLVVLFALFAACSTGGVSKSDGAKDGGRVATDATPPAEAKLWPCPAAKAACNAHDTCAIDPVCGEDLLCHPQGMQQCDDGLPCTQDVCEGQGLCSHSPLPGTCALPVASTSSGTELRCFEKDAPSPADLCQICDPVKSASAWSPRNGGGCDDGNPCTRDDYCQAGVCKGATYDCADKLDCTDDTCDGKGGCGHALKAGQCLIDGTCYKQQDKDPSGCAVCDPAKDPSAWTMLTQSCLIGGQCYAAGAKNTAGCGSCDPAKNNTQWTPPADTCAINNVCVATGERSASGCGRCDPATSVGDWTPVPGTTATTTDFEAGLGGFAVSAASSGVGWQVSTLRPHGGKQSLYYGNPATKTYDTAASANSGSATAPAVALPAGQKAELHFWLYLDVEQSTAYDVLSVVVNSKEVWRKDATTMPNASYKHWVPVSTSLAEFAGTSATVVFKFETVDPSNNGGEGVYIDDVAIITGCGALPQKSPYVMDGKLDAGAVKVAGGSGTMPIYLAFSNDHLYLATGDAGEGNDNFVFLSTAAPGAPQAAPWKKKGTVAFGGTTLFIADENDNNYCGWFTLGGAAIVPGGGPFTGFYAVATPPANGGVLEGSINLKEVFGAIPSVIYVAAAAYGTNDGSALVTQTPPSKNSDGNIDANEILKVSLPGLQVIP